MRQSKHLPVASIGLLGVLLVHAPHAEAQTIRDSLSDLAAFGNLGKGFETIAVLGATPGVSSTKLNGDKLGISTHKLRLAHRFSRRKKNGEIGISPYAELTGGLARANETIAFISGRPDDFRLDLAYRSKSLLLAGGLEIPVGQRTGLKPMLLLGHSTLKIGSRYQGQDAESFYDLYDGLLDNARISTTFAGAAVQVDHKSPIFRDTSLAVSGRFSHYITLADEVTDRGLEPRGTTSVGTISAELERRSGIYVGEREIFTGVFTRGTTIRGPGRKLFGFDKYAELGASLRLDYPVDAGLGVGVNASIVRGPCVKGYGIGLSLRFAGASLLGLRQ